MLKLQKTKTPSSGDERVVKRSVASTERHHRGRQTGLSPSLSSSRTCLSDLAPWRFEQHRCCLVVFPKSFIPHYRWDKTFLANHAGLPRLHRADPSTSLDKSILFNCGCYYSRFTRSCQVELEDNLGLWYAWHLTTENNDD